MSQKWEPTAGKRSELRPFTGALHLLDACDVSYFQERYEISPEFAVGCIKVNRESGRYALPIFGPDAIVRGHVLRRPWADAPRQLLCDVPKADTYKHTQEPLQSHYWGAEGEDRGRSWHSDALVLVEDQLSAIKLAAHGYDSVALLGVPEVRYSGYSGSDRVMEIARRAKDGPVIIALDSDMTEVSFLFARKWGHAFSSIRVAMLTRDLKDTPAREFREIL